MKSLSKYISSFANWFSRKPKITITKLEPSGKENDANVTRTNTTIEDTVLDKPPQGMRPTGWDDK